MIHAFFTHLKAQFDKAPSLKNGPPWNSYNMDFGSES
jgi:hypothetical protein